MDMKRLIEKQRRFVRNRDWEQFHSPKNLASALVVEAAELLEIFQWMETAESRQLSARDRQKVSQEMADVFYFLLRLSDVLEIDLGEAFLKKMKINERKYPVHLAKGSAKKYDRLLPRSKRKSR